MSIHTTQTFFSLLLSSSLALLTISFLILLSTFNPTLAHDPGSSTSHVHHNDLHSHTHTHTHQCDHGHHHHQTPRKLPEELAEEEDLKLGFDSHYYYHHEDDHDIQHLTALGLWVNAMGCSLLVSLASLICLIILPLIFVQGKPSKTIVDALAVFGAGAMLGDAFLHQLPHAFGGDNSHSHDHQMDHGHHVHSENGHSQSHSHSIQDLSVGLSILAGIVLFLLVEKAVRYVDDMCGEANALSHGHHHHHRKSSNKLKDDKDGTDDLQVPSVIKKGESIPKVSSEGTDVDKITDDFSNGESQSGIAVLRKRNITTGGAEGESKLDDLKGIKNRTVTTDNKKLAEPPSNLVFGYLNLFSDGVHNFTDGMALGSAFLLYGSVGGWSRTLFLLAHELPQEIGDFGILVRSGFSVSAALSFNFLSALAALAGTALALLWGQDPGQSSLIEGFTAGGFIYIAVAGVLAEMNNGSTSLRSTAIQLTSLILGMTIALCISLYE